MDRGFSRDLMVLASEKVSKDIEFCGAVKDSFLLPVLLEVMTVISWNFLEKHTVVFLT